MTMSPPRGVYTKNQISVSKYRYRHNHTCEEGEGGDKIIEKTYKKTLMLK